LQQSTYAFYNELLKTVVYQGDIDPDIDLDATAFIFTTISISLGDYILKRMANPAKDL
jgi:hypothetical protein